MESSGTRFIVEAGTKLRLSEECIATACVYYHKFYSSLSEDDYHSNLVVMSSLSLATKVKEMPVKLSDVVNTCHRCLHPTAPVLEVTDLYWYLKDSVARYELLLLRVLRFDVNITMPHTFLLHYLLALSRWVSPSSWTRSHLPTISLSLLQDTYHTPLLLSHPPHVMATAVLYLAVLCCRLEVPCSSRTERQWWEVFSPDSSEEEIQTIARVIMENYAEEGNGRGEGEVQEDNKTKGGGRVGGGGGGGEGGGGEENGKNGGEIKERKEVIKIERVKNRKDVASKKKRHKH